MKRFLTLASLPLFLLLSACSEAPKTAEPKEPEKPAVPVSSRYAIEQMYITARSWQRDAMPLRLVNIDIPEVKSEAGKFGAWQCTFVSGHSARTLSYSVVKSAAAGLSKGVNIGQPDSWPGSGPKPFTLTAFQTDATVAMEVAMKKGADYVKKNPDAKINFLLEHPTRFVNPVWRVIWGESVTKSNYSVYVDATNGTFVKIER